MPVDWGSIPKSHVKPVIKDGIRRINGRQVALLVAMGLENGLSGDKLLEFIEFQCGVKLDKLEDVHDGPQMQAIVARLKG